MAEFQARFQEAFRGAQQRATARAKEMEQEARKVLETLGDRAQAELKTLLEFAQKGSREQMNLLGVELEKLGKKLQELAKAKETKEADGAGVQPPPAKPN
jgi:16S rRNA G527 N7-methylase RsmG